MMKHRIFVGALALTTLTGVGVGVHAAHAASSDVDAISLRTSRGAMASTLTWTHIVYNGERRDDGQHHFTSLRLASNTCADVSVAWFDGENPDPSQPDGVTARFDICGSVGGDSTFQFDLSRFNVPPAERAIVCLTTRPQFGIGETQQSCVTSLPFTDSPITGI